MIFIIIAFSAHGARKKYARAGDYRLVGGAAESDLHSLRNNCASHTDNPTALFSRNNYYGNSHNPFLGRSLSSPNW